MAGPLAPAVAVGKLENNQSLEEQVYAACRTREKPQLQPPLTESGPECCQKSVQVGLLAQVYCAKHGKVPIRLNKIAAIVAGHVLLMLLHASTTV